MTDEQETKLRGRITALRQALIAITKHRPHRYSIIDAQTTAQAALDEDDYAAGRPRKK